MSQSLELEYQYAQYLKRMKLVEPMMGEQQKKETKLAFYAGVSQTLSLMFNEVANMKDEHRAVLTLDDLVIQCQQFWESQS